MHGGISLFPGILQPPKRANADLNRGLRIDALLERPGGTSAGIRPPIHFLIVGSFRWRGRSRSTSWSHIRRGRGEKRGLARSFAVRRTSRRRRCMRPLFLR